MRKIILAALFSMCFVSAAYAQAATLSEVNVSRPGGAYASAPAQSAAACASQCAGDNLCMAWDFAVQPQICELKAVTPAPRAASGFVSGLSARAPAFARAMSVPTPLSPPPQAEPASAPQPSASPAPHNAPAPSNMVEEGLLGGPETAPNSEIRTRSAP